MYSDRELNLLAAHKLVLRHRIARRRIHCVAVASQVVRPFAWLDRAVDLWRRLSPVMKLAAVPLGLLVTRAITPRFKVLTSLARWGPLAFAAVRGLKVFGRSRAAPSG